MSASKRSNAKRRRRRGRSMDAATETKVYDRTLSIDAAPETVWEFLVDPEKLKRWKGIAADLDARPGGHLPLPGHPRPHRARRVRRGRSAEPARLHLGLGRGGSRPPRFGDDHDRPCAGRTRHVTAVRACDPAEQRSGDVARARVGSLPAAAR